jgi:hypothetical protein
LGFAFFDFPRFDFSRFDFLGDEARLKDFFRPRVDFFRDVANTPIDASLSQGIIRFTKSRTPSSAREQTLHTEPTP